MAIAEGRTIPFTGPEAIDVAVLETFPYAGPDQEIVTETREFSPVCPYSGLPDFATLRITYVPSDRCIELKSLKYYVNSYPERRNFPGARHGADRRRSVALLRPQRLEVTTIYNTRGGSTRRVPSTLAVRPLSVSVAPAPRLPADDGRGRVLSPARSSAPAATAPADSRAPPPSPP